MRYVNASEFAIACFDIGLSGYTLSKSILLLFTMQSSGYFRKSIYYEQNPAAVDHWEARIHAIFVTDDSQSWLDAYSNDAFDTFVPADGLDGQPLAGFSYPQNHIVSQNDSLKHKDMVQEAPQPGASFTVDEGSGKKCELHRGLRLQKLRHKSELLQFLSVLYLSMEHMFITY